MTRFEARLYQDEDGAWIAICPVLPGCAAQGGSRDAALACLTELIPACVAARRECGLLETCATPAADEPQQRSLEKCFVDIGPSALESR